MESSTSKTQISLSILLSFILLFPSFLAGFAAKYIYTTVNWHMFSGEYFFGFAPTFSYYVNTLLVSIFPEIIHGGVASYLSIFLTAKILKKAIFSYAAWSLSAITVLLVLIPIPISVYSNGFDFDMVGAISNGIGLIIGFFLAAEMIDKERATAKRPTPVEMAG